MPWTCTLARSHQEHIAQIARHRGTILSPGVRKGRERALVGNGDNLNCSAGAIHGLDINSQTSGRVAHRHAFEASPTGFGMGVLSNTPEKPEARTATIPRETTHVYYKQTQTGAHRCFFFPAASSVETSGGAVRTQLLRNSNAVVPYFRVSPLYSPNHPHHVCS